MGRKKNGYSIEDRIFSRYGDGSSMSTVKWGASALSSPFHGNFYCEIMVHMMWDFIEFKLTRWWQQPICDNKVRVCAVCMRESATMFVREKLNAASEWMNEWQRIITTTIAAANERYEKNQIQQYYVCCCCCCAYGLQAYVIRINHICKIPSTRVFVHGDDDADGISDETEDILNVATECNWESMLCSSPEFID